MATDTGQTLLPLRRNRDFRRLWIGNAISDLGSRAADLATPLLVLSLTGSPAVAGAVGSVRMAAFVAFALPGGSLADRADRRRVLIGAGGIRAAAAGTLAVAVWAGWVSVTLLIGLAVIEAVGMAAFGPAHTAALRHIVPDPQLGVASAREEARGFAAELAGPPLGGVLFGIASWAPFAADAVSYLAAIAAVARIRTRLHDRHDAAAPAPKASTAAALRFVRRQPFLRIALVLAPLSNIAVTGLFFVVVVVLRQRGLSPAGIGSVQAAIMIGGLLGALIAPRLLRLVRPATLIIFSTWLGVVLVGSLTVLPGTYVLALPLVLLMVAGPAENAIFFAYQVTLTPDHLQGRVQGIAGMLSQALSPLGPLVGGLLIQHAGQRWAFVGIASVLATAAILTTASRGIRETRDRALPSSVGS